MLERQLLCAAGDGDAVLQIWLAG